MVGTRCSCPALAKEFRLRRGPAKPVNSLFAVRIVALTPQFPPGNMGQWELARQPHTPRLSALKSTAQFCHPPGLQRARRRLTQSIDITNSSQPHYLTPRPRQPRQNGAPSRSLLPILQEQGKEIEPDWFQPSAARTWTDVVDTAVSQVPLQPRCARSQDPHLRPRSQEGQRR